jgi:hypothetical protein
LRAAGAVAIHLRPRASWLASVASIRTLKQAGLPGKSSVKPSSAHIPAQAPISGTRLRGRSGAKS